MGYYLIFLTPKIVPVQGARSKVENAIVTIPRTGSHYLNNLIRQHTGVNIKKSHEEKPGHRILTIARNPYDTVLSCGTMSYHYYGYHDFGFSQYLDLGKYLLNADIVIDYNDLIIRPFDVMVKISDILDIPIINDHYEDNLKDQPKYNHLTTSTTSEHYDQTKQALLEHDLSSLYDIYYELLGKSLEI